MDSKRKTILLFLVLVVIISSGHFAGSVSAQSSDYLMVDIRHSAKDGLFSILSVDQVIADQENAGLDQSGQYKLSLFNSAENKDISSNYFSFSENSYAEAIVPEDSAYPDPNRENKPKTDQEIIVALPLAQSADMADLAIRIEDVSSGKILLEKPLADTTFEVRSADQFNVNEPPPPEVPIPDNLFPEDNIFSKYLWYIIGGIVLLLLGLIVALLIWRKRKSTTPPPPNNSL